MNPNKNELATASTTSKLLLVARNYFSTIGYEKSSLETIAKTAGMTRGAVYHHFKSKKSLFLAVLSQVQNEVAKHVESQALLSNDIWEQLILGCVGFVEAATLETNKRILLIDSLSVVEWDEWRHLDNENSVELLIEQLHYVNKFDKLVNIDITLLAHLISGALNELSLHIAVTKEKSRNELYTLVEHMLKGFMKNVD